MYTLVGQERLRPLQPLVVDEGEPEPEDVTIASAGSIVRVRTQVAVAADHAGKVATPVIGSALRPWCEPTGPHQLVVDREVWTPSPTLLPTRDVLPASIGQEAMIPAGHEHGSVFEEDPVPGLDRRPVGEDLGRDIAAVPAPYDRSADRVSHLHVGDGFRAPVRRQDRGFGTDTVAAGMTATPIRVDRPVEREVVPGHVVDDRLALGLDELHPPELGRVEPSSRDLEQGLGGHPRTIEHTFDSGKPSPSRPLRPRLRPRWRSG